MLDSIHLQKQASRLSQDCLLGAFYTQLLSSRPVDPLDLEANNRPIVYFAVRKAMVPIILPAMFPQQQVPTSGSQRGFKHRR